MADRLRCPWGHHWDWDEDEVVTPDTICPVCGCKYTDSTPAETLIQTTQFNPNNPYDLTVPGYELQEQLGAGGMGVVFRARQISTDRIVALKLPHSTHDLAQKLRFHEEGRAVARLQHPGIVQVFEVGETNGQPFMSLEYCAGGSLADRLNGSPLPPRNAAIIMAAIAAAVGNAHRAGIIHRDLKPGNILLAAGDIGMPSPVANQIPKVADFGLARRLDSDLRQTQDGSVLGTASYMAPEQARGENINVGAAADVYSLGSMLYELLTGRPPFRGATVLETLEQVTNREPVPPTRLQPTIPRDLETITLTALRKEPTKRYTDGDALTADLRRFLDGQPVLARPIGWPERLWKTTRRNPLTAALLLVLTASILGGIGFGVWKQLRLREERDRSRAHFQMSLRAIDELLTEVAEQDLATEPHAEQTRQSLLEKAHGFYREILIIEAGDPVVAWEAAQAARRLGDIDRLLGRYTKAIEAYDEALSRLQQLRTAGRDDDENWRETAHVYNWRGECLRLLDRLADADSDYREAIAIYIRLRTNPLELAQSLNNRGLAAGGPFERAESFFTQANDVLKQSNSSQPSFRHQAARVALNRSNLLRKAKNPTEAARAAEHAVQLFDALIAERADRLEYQHERASAGLNLAIARYESGDRSGAVTTAVDARTRLEGLSRLYPNTVLFLVDLARVCTALAAFTRQADHAAAVGHTRSAISHWEKLLEKQPNVPAYHGELGIALGNLGRLTKDRDVLLRGIDEVLIVLKANPEDPDFRQSLRRQTRDLAEALATAGDKVEAIGIADRLHKALPGYGTNRAICLLSLVGKAVNSPDALVDKAIEMIRESDPQKLKGLLQDSDMEYFRSLPAIHTAFNR